MRYAIVKDGTDNQVLTFVESEGVPAAPDGYHAVEYSELPEGWEIYAPPIEPQPFSIGWVGGDTTPNRLRVKATIVADGNITLAGADNGIIMFDRDGAAWKLAVKNGQLSLAPYSESI